MSLQEKLQNTTWEDDIDGWKEKFLESFYQTLDDPQLVLLEEMNDSAYGKAWATMDSAEWFMTDPEQAGAAWAEKCRADMEDEIYQYAEPKTIECKEYNIILPESNKDYRCLYPKEFNFQPAILVLDFENEMVYATFAGSRNSVPEPVYNGRSDFIGFPHDIDLLVLRGLMEDMKPLFDQAFKSYSTDIVDGNLRGSYDLGVRDDIEQALISQKYTPSHDLSSKTKSKVVSTPPAP